MMYRREEMERKNEIELRIPKIEVVYPSEDMINRQRNEILARSFPPRKPFWEKIKDIYWGPGLSVIFYQNGLSLLITGMVYLLCIAFYSGMNKNDISGGCFLLFLCPVSYLLFSLLSFWSEEQSEVVELKHTLHYSFPYLVSLRMFYSSILAVLANLMVWAVPGRNWTKNFWPVTAVGISGMFLFATLSLYLYHSFGRYTHIIIMLATWTALCIWLARSDTAAYHYLFEVIPLALHFAVAGCSFIGFALYIRKAGKENAYTYACE